MPNGFTDFSKPDGTGAFALESFEPGVRVITKNKGNYWKPGRGNFDSVELRYIPDSAARVQALLSGQIDAANRLDAKTVSFVMKAPTVNVVRTKGTGNRFAFVALCDVDPYTSNDIRLALKYGIDRQKIVDTVYKGFATVGNDTTVPPSMKYFAKDIPQRPYDPDKAAFHFKKAGMANAKMELQVSEGAFSGATDAAVLYQEAMKKAGLDTRRQARLRRRLLGQCLAESPVLRGLLGRPSHRRQPTLANLPLDRELERHPLAASGFRQAHHRSARGVGRSQAHADVRGRAEDDRRRRRHGLFRDRRLSRRLRQEGEGTAPHPHYDMCDQRIAEKGWFA